MTTPRKRVRCAMKEAILALLYIRDDSTVAVHASAHGFTVTKDDVARVRRSQPRSQMDKRAAHYLRERDAKRVESDGEHMQFKARTAEASAALLAKLAAAHPHIQTQPSAGASARNQE